MYFMVSIVKFSSYRALLGEGPVYDIRTNKIFWVDIDGHKIKSKDLDEEKESVIKLPDVVSSIQLKEDTNKLLATLRHGFYEVDIENGNTKLIAEVEKDMPQNRFNDGKCDSIGRYWAGTMNIQLDAPTGALYSLEVDNKIVKHLDGLTISNGLAWSLDNKFFYLIDTKPKKVYRFNFDLIKGEISNQLVAIDFSDERGRPDGMTIDSEGKLWIAHSRGGRISRWDPQTERNFSK